MSSGYLQFPLFLLLIHSILNLSSGFGSMGPISAAFGKNRFFCAIDASGKQEVICWGKNNSISSTNSALFGDIPAMFALTGGNGFMCGILANTSTVYCWELLGSNNDVLVPDIYRNTAYTHVAAGKSHVCAIRGSYFSDNDWGTIDCWEIVARSNSSLSSLPSSLYYDESITNLVFRKVVSGDGFSCGEVREGGLVCWGPEATTLGVSGVSEVFVSLASGMESVCGISGASGEVKCWGENQSFIGSPVGIRFVSLAAGAKHFCGIREDNHGIECWGHFNISAVPKGSGFMAIASSDVTTCGIREDDLVLDCWFVDVTSAPDYDPPLQLCSPGLCTLSSCAEGTFAFNASTLSETDLTSLCVRKDLKICSPCGSNCSEGFFLSSPCSENADRVCTGCSLCQNSSCWDVCKLQSTPASHKKHEQDLQRFVLIVGSSALGLLLLLISWCLLPCMKGSRKEEGTKKSLASCIGKVESEKHINADPFPPLSVTPCIGTAQVFRLSELKDATNGFKEFNELGRGSYGFVYKAVLADGRQVAVKRANAATIIHTNSRDFEMELEVLCNLRHGNIVNLLGYCSEMGERLLVYEYMPHGTLHDHLHGGLSPLNWSRRLKITMQAAKGLEFLHMEPVPPIVHRDVKTSNILLDSDWVARIADFGLLGPNERELSGDIRTDVYSFGIVLLEILSGRKACDRDYMPPSIVEWAVPLIRHGKAAATIDRNVALPKNVEPLLKLADIAELTLRENPSERPCMSDVATWLEQILKEGLIL
ncbi:Serine-threonine/tyrosine-protein kinase, catalytic domain [Dillenia turbinata]|uniref:non-specific serine/threonine protein kinase n=1 Tax=Dillenia turbinata TaxID=194707 RepID=A0AAN8ZMY9_9MAGN